MEHAWLEAVAAGAIGETSAARSLAGEAVGAAVDNGMATFALFAAFEAARLGAPDARALLARVPPVEGALAPALLAAGRALCEPDAGEADDAAVGLEALGCLLFAAELANTAAVRHAAAGRRGAAAASRSRAERLADRCEGATTERLRRVPDTPTLTPREREIATLAGRGVADAEIADRLLISVRTVQAHLHRAYTKLGVTSRRELHAVLDL
jgi:DNA-binding CsgD family transcriptional regulator